MFEEELPSVSGLSVAERKISVAEDGKSPSRMESLLDLNTEPKPECEVLFRDNLVIYGV